MSKFIKANQTAPKMVFTTKTLVDMLQEAGTDVNSSIDRVFDFRECLKDENASFAFSFGRAIRLLTDDFAVLVNSQASPNQGDCNLTGNFYYSGIPNLIFLLLENAIYRGSQGEAKPSLVEYFFGKRGLVFQITDNGCGFNPLPIIIATQNGTRKRGIHYQCQGSGFTAMNEPHYEVNINSSEDKPSGTTVTVMYKYQKSS